MTIEGHRNIKVMTGRGQKNRYENHATTFWFASEAQKPEIKENLRPFGWAELGELSAHLVEEFKEKEKGWKEKTDEKRKAMRAERDLQTEQMFKLERKATEDAERRKIEQDKKRKEEERKKAAFESMSPEERDIASMDDSKVTENQVNILYKRIDDFSLENKVLLAGKLKDYWIKHKKWTKKEVGKKKWKKVRERNQKIDEILDH